MTVLPSGASAVPCIAELQTEVVLKFLAFTSLEVPSVSVGTSVRVSGKLLMGFYAS